MSQPIKVVEVSIKEMYESLGELFLSRGLELGKGRALTAEEAAADPIVAPYLDHLVSLMLGEKDEVLQ